MHAFSEPTAKIAMKIDSYYQRQKVYAMTVVSGSRPYKVYMDILGGSLETRRQTTVVIENVDFQGVRRLIFCHNFYNT